MTTEAKTDSIEVDIDGVKLSVPKEVGDQLIAKRQESKAKFKELSEKVGKIEAEKAEAESKVRKATEDAAALEAAKKGEIDEVRKILGRQMDEERQSFTKTAHRKHLAAMIAQNKAIADSAVDDVTDGLLRSTKYDFKTDSLSVVGEAGQLITDDAGAPLKVDTFLAKWLEKKPHYLKDRTIASSGGTATKEGVTGKTISADAFEAMSGMEAAKFLKAGGKIS